MGTQRNRSRGDCARRCDNCDERKHDGRVGVTRRAELRLPAALLVESSRGANVAIGLLGVVACAAPTLWLMHLVCRPVAAALLSKCHRWHGSRLVRRGVRGVR
jgi:hypothetical protein